MMRFCKKCCKPTKIEKSKVIVICKCKVCGSEYEGGN